MHAGEMACWHRLFAGALAASTEADTARGRVVIHASNIRPVFRIVAPIVAGSVQVRLRFGFVNADADISSDTILFPAFATPGGACGQLLDTVSAANGGPLWIVPPKIAIFTTTVGFTGTFELHVALQTVK